MRRHRSKLEECVVVVRIIDITGSAIFQSTMFLRSSHSLSAELHRRVSSKRAQSILLPSVILPSLSDVCSSRVRASPSRHPTINASNESRRMCHSHAVRCPFFCFYRPTGQLNSCSIRLRMKILLITYLAASALTGNRIAVRLSSSLCFTRKAIS